jgi:uncharacterized membrane protein YgdD (TMEM256/DUF423 family)
METIGIIALGMVVVAVIVAFILIIRSTFTLEQEDRTRIIDLLVIGAIIYCTSIIMPPIMPTDSATSWPIVEVIGSLIFLYGFAILIYKKFQGGYRESHKGKEKGGE